MDLNKLYDIAEKENVKIYDWNIEDCDGIYLNYDKINAIALNYDELGTYIDEKCTLAEELGHYYMDATYSFSSNYETKLLLILFLLTMKLNLDKNTELKNGLIPLSFLLLI